ncbi:MAG: hypothetical protein DRO96_02465 [Candidatus Aenigmatarchaeota archaeon]|nr:MAG: hypothetical protein DRO96_02465 [Candidatus Aenigmarchaeota archaeon]
MNVIEAIKKRRSIREYKDKPVPEDTISKIIKAGVWAPSAHNRQPWSFIVLTNKEKINELSRHIEDRIRKQNPNYKLRDVDDPIFYSAPAVIIICGDASNKWSTIDCSMAAENIVLAATELELGTCFIGRIKYAEQSFLESLGMKRGHQPVIAISLGYPKETPTAIEREEPGISWVK